MYFTPFFTQCTALSYQIGFVHLQTFLCPQLKKIPNWEEQSFVRFGKLFGEQQCLAFLVFVHAPTR